MSSPSLSVRYLSALQSRRCVVRHLASFSPKRKRKPASSQKKNSNNRGRRSPSGDATNDRTTTASSPSSRIYSFHNNDENNKVFFQSLGCPRNLVDTEHMLGLVLQKGYEVVAEPKDANYLVLNTCGFLEEARKESTDTLDELLQIKSSKRNKAQPTKVVVTGCMVNLHKDQILERYPQVDAVLGAGSVDKILDALTKEEQQQQPESIVRDHHPRSYLANGQVPRTLATPPHYAYLKIAEGCKKRCSFCIIPKIKGPLRSKPVDVVLKEARALVQTASGSTGGVKELILIAQDLGDYGKDMIAHPAGGETGGASFESLLHQLCQSIPDPDIWFRLLYLYPDEITDGLICLLRDDPRICRYLDMPIQHISDRILRRMRRKTTGAEIRATITKLRTALPDVHIRTSLMVGFPGETEEEFQELLDFVRESRLDHVGVFVYSNEALADSSRIAEQIPEQVKQDRMDRLMREQWGVVAAKNEQRIGQVLECVLDGVHKELPELLTARYQGQCPDIDGQVLINEYDVKKVSLAVGQRYRVEITDYDAYDLIGRIVAVD